MGLVGRVAWFVWTVVRWSFGSGGPRMWWVVGDGCCRLPTVRLWFVECRSSRVFNGSGAVENVGVRVVPRGLSGWAERP